MNWPQNEQLRQPPIKNLNLSPKKGKSVSLLEKTLKGALDLLPFDGDKTKLGLAGIGTAVLGIPIPADPRIWLITSGASLILGVLHKWLKRKYPTVKWPAP